MEKFYEKKNLGIPVTILVVIAYFIGYSLTRSLSGTLLVAVIFAGAVFSLQFDERVKNAIKHSFIFATYFHLLYLAFNVFSQLISMLYGGSLPSLGSFSDGFYGFGIVPRVLTFLYTYGLIIVDISLVVIFGLFILMSLLNKDMNLFCVKKVLGEAPAKPKNPVPAPQASAPAPQQRPVQQPVPAPQQPVSHQPVPAPQQPVSQQPAPAPQQPVSHQPVPTPVSAPAPAPAPTPGQVPVPAPATQAPEQRVSGACSNCGKVNNSGAKFCAFCGSKQS